jgi:phosphoribosylanthranilate isomerase
VINTSNPHIDQTRTRIKLCGLTRLQDIEHAASLGVDAIGLVFYPASPRAVNSAQAAALAARVPPFISVVGLFVNTDEATLRTITDQVPLSILQFHGDETPAQCAALAQQVRLPWLRALRISPGPMHPDAQATLLASARCYTAASGLVLDACVAGYGGGGVTFDWSSIPPTLTQQIILSGGLNAHNVGSAIADVRPYAVDVSSGIEVSGMKGVKDAARMTAFVHAVRAADAARVRHSQ